VGARNHVKSNDVVATDPGEQGPAGAEIQGRISKRRSCRRGDRGECQHCQDRNRKPGSQPKRAASHRRVFFEPIFRVPGARGTALTRLFWNAYGDEQ